MVYGEFCNLRQMQFAIRLLLIMIIPLMPIFTLLWPCFDESVSFILSAWPERLLARWINLSTFPAATNSLFLCSATMRCLLVRGIPLYDIATRMRHNNKILLTIFTGTTNSSKRAVYFHRQQGFFSIAQIIVRTLPNPVLLYWRKFYCSLNNATVTNGGVELNLLLLKFSKCEKIFGPRVLCYYANSVAAF